MLFRSFNIKLTRALEILAMPKMARGGQEVLKDFGKPTGFDEKIQVLNGRYGIYIKSGKTNVSLPKDTNLEKFTIDDAISLLEEKLKAKKGSSVKKSRKSNKKITKENNN